MESIRALLKESKLEAVAHRNTEMLKTVSEETPVSEAIAVRVAHVAGAATCAKLRINEWAVCMVWCVRRDVQGGGTAHASLVTQHVSCTAARRTHTRHAACIPRLGVS